MQPREALDQQSGADEQHEGERRLDDDERRACEAGALPRRAARRVFLEHRARVAADDGERRHQAEHQPGDQREQRRERQHGRVQRGTGHTGHMTRTERDKAADAGEPQREAPDRAARRQHHAFGEELP